MGFSKVGLLFINVFIFATASVCVQVMATSSRRLEMSLVIMLNPEGFIVLGSVLAASIATISEVKVVLYTASRGRSRDGNRALCDYN